MFGAAAAIKHCFRRAHETFSLKLTVYVGLLWNLGSLTSPQVLGANTLPPDYYGDAIAHIC